MSLMKSYRGIAIAEVLSKVYTSMLKKRLQPLYESVAPEYSCGFRPGRSRNDSVFAVKEQLRKRKEWGLDSYLVLWDVKTCFDVIPKEHIWKSMHLLGVDPKMIAAVKSTLKDTTCTMTVDGVTKTVNMVDGSGQGTTLGPMLCNMFFLPILQQWCKDMVDTSTVMLDAGGGSSTLPCQILQTTRQCWLARKKKQEGSYKRSPATCRTSASRCTRLRCVETSPSRV